MISFESRARVVAAGLALVLGPLALSGCGQEENNSWSGCTPVVIQPGVNNVGPSIIDRLEKIDKREGTDTHLEGGVHDTNVAALHAFGDVYDDVYGGGERVVLQAGDVFSFCVKDRHASFNDAGKILVKDRHLSYSQIDGKWQPTPQLTAAAK